MYSYQLIRKNRKTLSLRISPSGEVLVYAPLRFPLFKIEKFVQDNSDWVEKQLKKINSRPKLAPVVIAENASVLYFGESLSLSLLPIKSCKKEGERLLFPQGGTLATLKKFYALSLKEVALEYVCAYSVKMGVEPISVTITSAKTRWGSCSGKNALSFTFRLALCPLWVVEYVVVHELSHILHKNHSKQFWQEVERYYPSYKEAKKYLKDHAQIMEII